MSRITEAFKNKPIFMPYFPLGYPDLDISIDVIETMAKNGADLMEVGLSFSDPLADGPVIQHATQIALKAQPGKITDRELEKEFGGSGLRYSFDVKTGNVTHEVGIDARTGKVLENSIEGADAD